MLRFFEKFETGRVLNKFNFMQSVAKIKFIDYFGRLIPFLL